MLCGAPRFIFDAGTGLRALGETLQAPVDADLFFSHCQGDQSSVRSFVRPAYSPDNRFVIWGGHLTPDSTTKEAVRQAMKIMGQEGLLGPGPDKSNAEHLLRYTLSLPVAAAVVGMPTLDMLRQNAALGRTFTPMSKGQMDEFSTRIAAGNKLALDLKFSDHKDA